MRLFWLVTVLLAVTAIGLYFNPEFKKRLPGFVSDTVSGTRTTRVYKWRNGDGQWQISDSLPPDGLAYETLDYHDDTNVLPVSPRLEAELSEPVR